MIAVPSRPSAEWNRWVKKDPFLTYAPLGDPSCANMKRKPCGFYEAPALRARRENGIRFCLGVVGERFEE